jgi:hypothetical protein
MRRANKKKLKQCTVMVMLLSPLLSLLLQLFRLTKDSFLEGSSANHYNMNVVQQTPQRPGLETVMTSKGEIFGDPQFLLDVAIVGFPKCGTTALQDWLSQHPQVQFLPGEPFPLMHRKPYLLIYKLYTQLPAEDGPTKFVRGYKNPLDIRAQPSISTLAKFFPKTLLIVGLRHPVHWFESLYNFKIQNLPGHVDPAVWGDPNSLVDECEDWLDVHCVGTAKGWFHVYLASLGKVQFPQEWRSEYPRYLQNVSSATPVPNPIFLYETNQLNFEDTHNSTTAHYSDQLRRDLQVQLGLNSPLDMTMSRAKPDMEHFNERQQRRKDRHKIHICREQYLPLRKALMVIARRSSEWIRNDFMKSPDVFVSSPDYFVALMEKWMMDPCEGVESRPSTT